MGPRLATIARRVAIDVHRRESARAATPLDEVPPGDPAPASAPESAERVHDAWRIELRATGLPHLQNGRYYQAWLKNAAGILVPVGTFNDVQSVTLWSGVPVTEFRTLTVTQQAANGNPASSGRRVLIGTITPGR